jgi:hypothetical protein
MTTASTTARRALTVAVTFFLTLATGATAAMADAPVSDDWPTGEARSTLDTLLLFGGGTIGLFLLVALFGLLTARTNYVPPPPSRELATTPAADADHH